MSKTGTPAKMIEVNDVSEIPAFQSETEERDFWSTHSFGHGFLEQPTSLDDLPAPRARTRPVSMRFDESTIQRLRTLAEKRHKGYQSLAREFIVERLYEEERREGIVPKRAASR